MRLLCQLTGNTDHTDLITLGYRQFNPMLHVASVNIGLATDYHQTKISTGVDGARAWNSKVYWTSHTMMMVVYLARH